MLLPAVVPELSDDEMGLLRHLWGQLQQKQRRNALRETYYDQRNVLEKIGFSIPPSMRDLSHVVGWPAKAVDSVEARLELQGFVTPTGEGVYQPVADIFDDNHMELESGQAHVHGLVNGCAFVSVTRGDGVLEPEVLVQVHPALETTGLWDRRRRVLRAALWVREADFGRDPSFVLFLADRIVHAVQVGREWSVRVQGNPVAPRVPVVPLLNRPRTNKPFGSSRITRGVMALTDQAMRTMLRTEVSAEFFSSPQRWALNTPEDHFQDESGRFVDRWKALLGGVWALPPMEDEDGNLVEGAPKPEVGQFPQMSMQPHTDHLRSIAMMYAAETGMPVSYLGVVHDNPASAEAITAAESELVSIAERCQRTFGAGWAQVAQLAEQVRQGSSEVPDEVRGVRAKWRDASTPTKHAQAMAVRDLINTGSLPPQSEVTFEQLGFDQVTISRLMNDSRRSIAERLINGSATRDVSPEAVAIGSSRVQVDDESS